MYQPKCWTLGDIIRKLTWRAKVVDMPCLPHLRVNWQRGGAYMSPPQVLSNRGLRACSVPSH
jgi:hypothetical protein